MTLDQPNPLGRFVRAHALRAFLIALAILLVYAFAIHETGIDLQKPLDPNRQATVLRVLRLMADPDFFDSRPVNGASRIVLSEASRITLERIVETILMALVASTVGTLLAVPVSFLAARNLMADVVAPLAAIMFAIVLLPVGTFLGLRLAAFLVAQAASLTANTGLGLAALLLVSVLTWATWRFGAGLAGAADDGGRSAVVALLRLIVVALLGLLSLAILAELGLVAGRWLEDVLGTMDFVGNFIFVVSDFLRLSLPWLVAFLTGLGAASLGNRYGQEAVLGLPTLPARLVTAVLTMLGAAVFIYAVGATLNWLYQFDRPENWTTIPAVVGGAIVGPLSLVIAPKRPFSIGFTIYTVSRTVLNILRSIEPLILGIVFVVWVSLGPFAGVMALTLHSIAALGKLFSEQVEGIYAGSLEAVTATGANRLQTIVYAVIPQIVPPFVAFSLYRWDINVRLSTIIGFVGGGGIGFVLSQNIQQLRYQQASVMMIAIAVVVASLDYVSARIRQRII